MKKKLDAIFTVCYTIRTIRRAVNSAGECHPHTVEVAGSNPVPPTIKKSRGATDISVAPFLFSARQKITSQREFDIRIPQTLSAFAVKVSCTASDDLFCSDVFCSPYQYLILLTKDCISSNSIVRRPSEPTET
jgi:hypothetical protein